jgi:hypothetical protein
MQDPPEKEMLLAAVARFLAEEIRPVVTDARLNFRVLVAAHLAMTVANECRTGAADQGAELARLRAFYPGADAPLAELNARLSNDVREGVVSVDDERLRDHVKKTLLAKLAVNSPRFDTSLEIE